MVPEINFSFFALCIFSLCAGTVFIFPVKDRLEHNAKAPIPSPQTGVFDGLHTRPVVPNVLSEELTFCRKTCFTPGDAEAPSEADKNLGSRALRGTQKIIIVRFLPTYGPS